MLIENLKRLSFFLLLGTIATAAIGITPYEIFSVSFILISLVSMIVQRGGRAVSGRWMVFFVVYFLANALSLTQTHYMADSLKGMLRVTRSILLCISVINTLDTEEKFLKAFKWFLAVALVISMNGLVQSVAGFDLIRHRPLTNYHADAGRVTSTFNQANDFSGYITLALFFFVGIIAEIRHLKLTRGQTLFCAVGFIGLLLCLLWTYSRGAWISIGASLTLFALLKRKKVLMGGLALALVWVVLFSPPLLRQRFESLLHPGGGSMTERRVLMGESMTMIEASPWFGLGINTFSANAPFFKSKTEYTDLEYAHNGYLQMAVETGIVGLLTFLLILSYFIFSTGTVFLRASRSPIAVAGTGIYFGILAFLMHSAMDTNLHSLLLVSSLWLCLGLAWSAADLTKRRMATV